MRQPLRARKHRDSTAALAACSHCRVTGEASVYGSRGSCDERPGATAAASESSAPGCASYHFGSCGRAAQSQPLPRSLGVNESCSGLAEHPRWRTTTRCTGKAGRRRLRHVGHRDPAANRDSHIPMHHGRRICSCSSHVERDTVNSKLRGVVSSAPARPRIWETEARRFSNVRARARRHLRLGLVSFCNTVHGGRTAPPSTW